MAKISFDRPVTLAQAVQIIVATPNNRYMLVGEPGIGKSSLMGEIKRMTGYECAYIDVPNLDLGDTAMPVLNHDNKTTEYYPNARFKLHEGVPVAIMLDEYSKGVDPVKNMLHPLFETSNPRLGDVAVHPDSIVFLTGNLSTDGVGDNLKAHSKNRLIRIPVRKPSAEEWLLWAADNEIDPVVMAFVDQFPHALASYLDDKQEENPYIYHPSKSQNAFLSPRSLERASNIIKKREMLDVEILNTALIGAIGNSGATDLTSFIDYQDQLPRWDEIIANPKKTAVPKSAGACSVMVFSAVQKISEENVTPFMEYVSRMKEEWQTIFCIHLAKSKTKQQVAFKCAAFADWVEKNEDLL